MRPIQTRARKAISVILILAPLAGCDDEFTGASTSVDQSWTVGATPRVVVDACAGGIIVKRGTDGEVKATIARNSNCKNESQAISRDSLKFLEVEMGQQENVIRIVSRRTDNETSGCFLSTSVWLWVPNDARLDLKTGNGSIWVAGSPREVKAYGGAMGFELYSPDQSGIAEPQPLRLEGWGGDVEITLGPTGYEFRGPIAAVERFR